MSQDHVISTDETLYWESLRRLDGWLRSQEYKAYDPFDGLSSFLRPLTFRKRFPQQVLQQFVRRNPWNLRPLLGIKPHRSTKGMGFLAAGYARLSVLTSDAEFEERARWCYRWLMENGTPGYSGHCWGNAFDYVSRGSDIPRGAPTVVWSGLIGHHFIEGYRIYKDPEYLKVAVSVGEFILHDLPRISTAGGLCLSYVTDTPIAVHNANLLGARLLAELYGETGEGRYLEVATEAARYSAAAQLENGAWYYGEESKFHWIDNWHTAYNLDSLLEYQTNTGDEQFQSVLRKGMDFYVRHFFREDGAARYYWDRDYKFDIQSCSQAIDTLILFSTTWARPEWAALAERVARWTIDNMQDRSGYFYLWKNKWFTNTTPTFHWGAATMFHALSQLLSEVHNRER